MSAFPTKAEFSLAPHINTGEQVLTEFCGEDDGLKFRNSISGLMKGQVIS